MSTHPTSAGSVPTTAVVLAGGLGTRMGRLSADLPKHLLEVAGEPVVVHQLRWLAAHGILDVVLATSHLAERFEPVLGDGRRWGVRLRYSTEPSPLGTAGALRLAARALDRVPERLVVVNGDLLTGHDLSGQLSVGAAAAGDDSPGADVVLHLRTVADARPYGCVVADVQGRVSAFVEKSGAPPSHEVNGGTYVVTRAVVESIADGVVSLERDVLPEVVAHGRVMAYREQALWEDVGTPAALVRASRTVVLASGGAAHVDPTAVVHPAAHVCEGSAIGPGAVVGAEAWVIGSVVSAGAVVETGARLEDTALGPGERVARDQVVTGVDVSA